MPVMDCNVGVWSSGERFQLKTAFRIKNEALDEGDFLEKVLSLITWSVYGIQQKIIPEPEHLWSEVLLLLLIKQKYQ